MDSLETKDFSFRRRLCGLTNGSQHAFEFLLLVKAPRRSHESDREEKSNCRLYNDTSGQQRCEVWNCCISSLKTWMFSGWRFGYTLFLPALRKSVSFGGCKCLPALSSVLVQYGSACSGSLVGSVCLCSSGLTAPLPPPLPPWALVLFCGSGSDRL